MMSRVRILIRAHQNTLPNIFMPKLRFLSTMNNYIALTVKFTGKALFMVLPSFPNVIARLCLPCRQLSFARSWNKLQQQWTRPQPASVPRGGTPYPTALLQVSSWHQPSRQPSPAHLQTYSRRSRTFLELHSRGHQCHPHCQHNRHRSRRSFPQTSSKRK